jgi:hypothetical protein
MSGHLTSLLWEVDFPTSTQKLLMLRLADYADDDGRGIYPSIPEVARQIGSSERQIQYALKALEAVNLIDRVAFGGTGPKRTNVWTINVDLVAKLALQELVLNGTHSELEAVENEGAIIAPRTLARVQSRIKRVQSATDKGATDCTQATKEPNLEPNSAGAPATHSAARPALKKAIRILASDASWANWIEHIEQSGSHEMAAAARAAGEIVACSRWPTDASPLPAVQSISGGK